MLPFIIVWPFITTVGFISVNGRFIIPNGLIGIMDIGLIGIILFIAIEPAAVPNIPPIPICPPPRRLPIPIWVPKPLIPNILPSLFPPYIIAPVVAIDLSMLNKPLCSRWLRTISPAFAIIGVLSPLYESPGTIVPIAACGIGSTIPPSAKAYGLLKPKPSSPLEPKPIVPKPPDKPLIQSQGLKFSPLSIPDANGINIFWNWATKAFHSSPSPVMFSLVEVVPLARPKVLSRISLISCTSLKRASSVSCLSWAIWSSCSVKSSIFLFLVSPFSSI